MSVVRSRNEVVLFVNSRLRMSELIKLIKDAAGFHAPLIKINVSKSKGSNRSRETAYAFCAVPTNVADVLVKYDDPKAVFRYAKFKKQFAPDARGLHIQVPAENTQFSWMRSAIRKQVLNCIQQLVSRGLVGPDACKLTRGFNLYVNDSTDETIEIVHAFIDGLPFYNGSRVYYIRAFYLLSRSDDGKKELGDVLNNGTPLSNATDNNDGTSESDQYDELM